MHAHFASSGLSVAKANAVPDDTRILYAPKAIFGDPICLNGPKLEGVPAASRKEKWPLAGNAEASHARHISDRSSCSVDHPTRQYSSGVEVKMESRPPIGRIHVPIKRAEDVIP